MTTLAGRLSMITTVVMVLTVAVPSVGADRPPKPQTNKCMMVIGAHADDVEEVLAGGTMAKYKSEGYELVYVTTTNNAAGCVLNRALPPSTAKFTEKPVPHEPPPTTTAVLTPLAAIRSRPAEPGSAKG